MVYLGAFGLRWGEVAGLRVDRLDLLRQTITIDGQRTRGLHGEMIDANPKTKAGRLARPKRPLATPSASARRSTSGAASLGSLGRR